MRGKYFLDTNIIVYSFDKTDPGKQTKAKELIRDALSRNKGIVSYQVIQEFTNAALQKFSVPLAFNDCKNYIEDCLAPICEIFSSIDLFRDAVDIKSETGIRYYDALIVAAAIKGNANTLYTEDLNDGQKIRSVKIVNPFK